MSRDVVQCGASWFVNNNVSVYEYKGDVTAVSNDQTEADVLNGVGYSGLVYLRARVARWHNRDGWDRWMNADPDTLDGYVIGVLGSPHLCDVRREGVTWKVRPMPLAASNMPALSCSAIPR
jgi:hypothetical protein